MRRPCAGPWSRLMGAALSSAAATTATLVSFAIPVTAQEAAPGGVEPTLSQPPSIRRESTAYGYVRRVQGSATLLQSESGNRVRAEVNEPLLTSDRIFVSSHSRIELALSDRNLVRLGGGAELGLEALAFSADREERSTALELRRGELQLVVVEDFLGDDYPLIHTPNATIVIRDPGSYLIASEGHDRTRLVVREGRARVETDDERAVDAGEQLEVHGPGEGVEPRRGRAGYLTSLERWGQGLGATGAADADSEAPQYVAGDLYYASRPLRRYGSWIYVDGVRAWRPRVRHGWHPYWYGHWRYTPTGLFWVSSEPWGWVPYHYGSWDYDPHYGWVWYPGHRFSPAWVYWYWGPQYVGWVPAGYYSRHYAHHYGRGFHFSFGILGWVAGGFGPFRYWVFARHDRFGRHHQGRYATTGYVLSRRRSHLDRGLLFTDSHKLTPERWRRPRETLRLLASDGSGPGSRRARPLASLPDATPFVHRVPNLPRTVEKRVLGGGDPPRAAEPHPRRSPRAAEPQPGRPPTAEPHRRPPPAAEPHRTQPRAASPEEIRALQRDPRIRHRSRPPGLEPGGLRSRSRSPSRVRGGTPRIRRPPVRTPVRGGRGLRKPEAREGSRPREGDRRLRARLDRQLRLRTARQRQ
ncbi:MAG: DUF6600 domain-containing protein [Gemmatimonadota bacterium]